MIKKRIYRLFKRIFLAVPRVGEWYAFKNEQVEQLQKEVAGLQRIRDIVMLGWIELEYGANTVEDKEGQIRELSLSMEGQEKEILTWLEKLVAKDRSVSVGRKLNVNIDLIEKLYTDCVNSLSKWDAGRLIPQERDFFLIDYIQHKAVPDAAMRAVLAQMTDHPRFSELVDRLESFLHSFPDDAELHNCLGVLYFFQGRMYAAAISFMTAFKLRHNFEKAELNLYVTRQAISSSYEWKR